MQILLKYIARVFEIGEICPFEALATVRQIDACLTMMITLVLPMSRVLLATLRGERHSKNPLGEGSDRIFGNRYPDLPSLDASPKPA
jgi:hypothetical protein